MQNCTLVQISAQGDAIGCHVLLLPTLLTSDLGDIVCYFRQQYQNPQPEGIKTMDPSDAPSNSPIISRTIEWLPLADLQLGQANDAMPSISTIFPTEIQKLILRHIDWRALIHLRATNKYYYDIITNKCQDLWKA